MGVCLVTNLTDAEIQHAKDRARLPKDDPNYSTIYVDQVYGGKSWRARPVSHPMPPTPRMPTCAYHDPGKPRTVAQAITELRKDAEQYFKRTDDARCQSMAGRLILPGYPIEITQGHYAIARRGEAHGAHAADRVMFRHATDLGIVPIHLTPDVWRSYAPVRQCANVRSKCITWTVKGLTGRLTLSARHGDDWSGSAWAPIGAGTPFEIGLSDTYVWPLRGVDWALYVDPRGPAAIFLAEEVAVVIMGMRL